MQGNEAAGGCCVVLVLVALGSGMWAGWSSGVHEIRLEAVKAGHATFDADAAGNVTFNWNSERDKAGVKNKEGR